MSTIISNSIRLFSVLIGAFFLCCVPGIVDAASFAICVEGESLTNADSMALHAALLDSVSVHKVFFETDVYMEFDEFTYLTDIHEGQSITGSLLCKAVRLLQKKRIFKTIEIKGDVAEKGLNLTIIGHGLWTFAKFKIHGLLTGKDRYHRCYIMRAGDPFDEHKHHQSLERIIDTLHSEGYYAAQLTTRLVRDQVTKSITVHSTINRGKKFTFGKTTLQLHTLPQASEAGLDSLRVMIDKKFLKPLYKKVCLRETLARRAGQLRDFLMQKGFFNPIIKIQEHVHQGTGCVDITVVVHLNQKRECIFIGNQFFSSFQLLNIIAAFGKSTALLPKSILREELIDLYAHKGFFEVEVQVREQDNKTFFIITEGERSRLVGIQFQGCKQYSSQELLSRYADRWYTQSIIDQDEIDKKLGEILSFYIDQGFLDARITAREYRALTGLVEKELVVTLSEGPLYMLTDAKILDIPEGLTHDFFAPCTQGNKIPFTVQTLREQRELVEDYLGQQEGHTVVVRPRIVYKGTDVSIVWHKDTPHHAMHFGKTICVGSSKLPFAYIMRELVYKEGDVWDQGLLKNSMKRLRSKDIFEIISLHPDSSEDELDKKNIIANLQLDDPYQIRMRGGFGLQQVSHEFDFLGVTYRAGGTFIFNNPFNLADQLSCELDFAKYDTSAVCAYRKPWLLGSPVHGLFQVYHMRQSHPGIRKSSENLYQILQQGGMITFSWNGAGLTIGINVGLEFMETSTADAAGQSQEDARSLARAIDFSPDLLDKKVPYGIFEPTCLIDRLDNKLQPSTGTLTLMALKGMLPLSTVGGRSYFVRCVFEHSVFVPLWSIVAALRVRLGHIFHDSFKTIMPPERFYLGGAHSVRSYDMDFVPPLGVFTDSHGVEHCVPRGGKSMVNINLELRMPLYKQFGWVIFQDFGLLSFERRMNLCLEQSSLATGVGLRYDTQAFGPLRFDIGWKTGRLAPCATRYAWFFTLGQAF